MGLSFGIPEVTSPDVAEPLTEKVISISGQISEGMDSPPFDDDFDLPSETKTSSSNSTFYYDFQVISSPPTSGFAIDLLSSGEVCDLETLNLGITIANNDNISPMNFDLEVGAYQIGEGYEGSLITDKSIVDMLSQASRVSQNFVERESYFPFFVISLGHETEVLDYEQSLVAPTWFSRDIVSDGMVFTCDEDMMGREIFPTGDELSLQRLGMYGTVSSNSVEDNSDDLLSFGVHESDSLFMFVEPPIAKLACARIDAIYSVLLATFSAEFLAQMIMDCKPKTVITFTAVRRESKFNYLKESIEPTEFIVYTMLSFCVGLTVLKLERSIYSLGLKAYSRSNT
ncbi:hypothetical protein RND71_014782 [Anisodus tanguticus]|uniref:Uncharacterized protein n=1 Tax=Anisodus tanguticus TaxID=243964 RepID=A0AAE1SCC5_9SOLA|nr:hypothetical protein RND71_014782 [Anisodus tanguticus]